MATAELYNLGENGTVRVNQYDDESSEYEYEDDGDVIETLSDIVTQTKQFPLGISSRYAPGMVPWQAFRELVQNWRDAIISTFEISEKDFSGLVIRDESTIGRQLQIVYKVMHPRAEPKDWLGYLRFEGTSNKDTNQVMGIVEIVNRNAVLQPWNLQLGGTSKRDSDHQAGTHGEGFKLAAMVMLRQPNHDIMCVSGGWNWKFNFRADRTLKAQLTRMSGERCVNEQVRSQKMHTKGIIPFIVSPLNDVRFVIGKSCTGRSHQGSKVKRQQVTVDEFRGWIKAALFLEDLEEGDRIITSRGDLIMADRLRQNLYIKGLLLKESTYTTSASVSGHPLKYGYNFASGKTDRDRHNMASAYEESKAIHDIWRRVITERKPALIGELSNVLNSTQPNYADAQHALENLHRKTAICLRTYLFSQERKWYYSAEEKSQNPRLLKLIEGLGREGVELTNTYWSTLKKYGLVVRTAEEEQEHRFFSADTAAVPKVEFSTEIHRMLHAGLKACPQTANTNIQFADAGELALLSIYLEDKDLLRVHSGWLVQERAIKELGLDADLVESDAVYHTAKHLLADALDQIPEARFEADGDHLSRKYKTWQKVQTEQRLINYMRMRKNFRIASSDDTRSLRVEWSSDLGWKSNLQVKIRLHRSVDRYHMSNYLLASDKMAVSAMVDEDELYLEKDTELDSGFTYLDGSRFAGLEVFATASVVSDEKSFIVLSRGAHFVSHASALSRGDNEPTSGTPNGTSPSESRDGEIDSIHSDWDRLLTSGPDELYKPEEDSEGADENSEVSNASAPSPRPVGSSRDASHLSNRADASERGVSAEISSLLEEQQDTPMIDYSAARLRDNLSQTQADGTYTLGERLMFVNMATSRHWYELIGLNGQEGVVGISSDGLETESESGTEVDNDIGPSHKRKRARK